LPAIAEVERLKDRRNTARLQRHRTVFDELAKSVKSPRPRREGGGGRLESMERRKIKSKSMTGVAAA
jgi:hypothetical protein